MFCFPIPFWSHASLSLMDWIHHFNRVCAWIDVKIVLIRRSKGSFRCQYINVIFVHCHCNFFLFVSGKITLNSFKYNFVLVKVLPSKWSHGFNTVIRFDGKLTSLVNIQSQMLILWRQTKHFQLKPKRKHFAVWNSSTIWSIYLTFHFQIDSTDCAKIGEWQVKT